ncbi:hypothetical protein, partial [Alloalcanivorax xenomutans]|uniref:hypothetical protein n=1 Tax=Alloalcanivorax xenomutans TaxID=1094342 RepID=UPI001F3A1B2E
VGHSRELHRRIAKLCHTDPLLPTLFQSYQLFYLVTNFITIPQNQDIALTWSERNRELLIKDGL